MPIERIAYWRTDTNSWCSFEIHSTVFKNCLAGRNFISEKMAIPMGGQYHTVRSGGVHNTIIALTGAVNHLTERCQEPSTKKAQIRSAQNAIKQCSYAISVLTLELHHKLKNAEAERQEAILRSETVLDSINKNDYTNIDTDLVNSVLLKVKDFLDNYQR